MKRKQGNTMDTLSVPIFIIFILLFSICNNFRYNFTNFIILQNILVNTELIYKVINHKTHNKNNYTNIIFDFQILNYYNLAELPNLNRICTLSMLY